MPYFIPLRFGSTWLALAADSVAQILGQLRWMRLPAPPTGFPGVAAWRGRAMSVLDLSLLVAEPPLTPESPRARAIIAQVHGSYLAIPADEVQEAVPIEKSEIRASHVTNLQHSLGEVSLKERVIPILDLAQAVSEQLTGTRPGPGR